MALVNVTIDGKQIAAQAGQTILEAAQSAGIEIPTLCHHPALVPIGACRVCLVEVEKQRTLQPACTFQVSEGMVVHTRSPKCEESRRFVLELLLSDHPFDCMTCERAGNCELQDLAYEYGIKESRYPGMRHEYPDTDPNPFFTRDYTKCILCRRCIRACDELNGVEAIGLIERGFDSKVGTAFDGNLADSPCEFCGMCVAVCPVGTLVPKQRLGKGREWEFQKVTTTCSYCGVGCQFDLNVKDGRIVQVTSKWDAPANHGLTCVKGRFGWDYVHHPDRLTQPLIRRVKGGPLEPATWDEALDLVADKLRQVKTQFGPGAFAALASAKCTNEENYVLQKFARAVMGTNNVDHCARLCHSASVTGLAAAFGSGAMTNSFDDLINDAQCYFIIGSNTTEQHPVFGMRIRQAVKRRGAKLIVCDPRRIPISEYATLHIRQKPGTDIALLNGIMYVLITEELYDKNFVAERTENFEAFKAKVLEYPPERAAAICGITAPEIVEAAHILAANRPGALIYSMGITQHTCGHQNVLSCANLQMLLGNMGVRGGGVNPLRGQSNVQGACDMGALPNVYTAYQAVTLEAAQKKFEEAWGVPLDNKVGLTVIQMLNAAEAGQIKAMYIMGENPMLSDPDLNHTEHCLKALDFLVVQDIFLTETARLADVVLPAASWAEKLGTITNTERRVQFIRPAVPVPGECKQDWWIVGQVARRMGYAELTYSGPEEIMREINRLTPSYAGITYERIGDQGLCWPCPSTDHPGTPILHVGKFSRGLGLFSAVDWQPPAEEPDEEYPFILTTGRILYHYHTGTQSRHSAPLDAHVPEGWVEINTQDAKKLNIQNGQPVRLTSRRGEIVARAQVSDMTEPGVVFMAFHWAEAAINKLTNAAFDPTAKIPELKVCAIRVQANA